MQINDFPQQKTPVVFGFELPIMSQNIELGSPYIIKLQEQYNVQVMLRTRPKLHATLVLVKGVEWEIKQVKMATMLLVEFMCENLAVSHLSYAIFLCVVSHCLVLSATLSVLAAILCVSSPFLCVLSTILCV